MKVPKLIWTLELPMILSMVLQAVYNIVDTAFVINMGEGGVDGNLALTYAFPVQLLIIAIGFTIYERFLQATGKTLFSTIAQIAGAAWATVIGQ